MSKYVCRREDVYLGKLVKKVNASEKEEANVGFSNENVVYDQDKGLYFCRNMFFTKNEDNTVNDLLYTTPTKYKLKDDVSDTCFGDFFVIDAISLNDLLEFFGFGECLTARDLYRVYKTFIKNNYWQKEYSMVFGYRLKKGKYHYVSESEVLDPKLFKILSEFNLRPEKKPSKEEPEFSYIKRRNKDVS